MTKIKVEDLSGVNDICADEMSLIKGGVIGDCGMPRYFFVSSIPQPQPVPGPTRWLIPENGRIMMATPIEIP